VVASADGRRHEEVERVVQAGNGVRHGAIGQVHGSREGFPHAIVESVRKLSFLCRDTAVVPIRWRSGAINPFGKFGLGKGNSFVNDGGESSRALVARESQTQDHGMS
jgi:hypothetical protein